MQQVIRRVWFRFSCPQPDKRPAPTRRLTSGAFCTPARRQASLQNAESFRFLNQAGTLHELGWEVLSNLDRVQEPTLLWRYNQHYFDDLNALDATQRQNWHSDLLQRWVIDNPPSLSVGWEPYPTSLRIVNWIKWQYAGHVLPDVCVESLAVQVRWLTQRLERHLLGNHLFANAKALVFAGCFFSGEEAHDWLQKGLKIIRQELPEQVLLDGGNFERSPMYHAIFLEDLLDLVNLSQMHTQLFPASAVASWKVIALKMQAWLDGMTHPDGEIALFNDGAIGISPSPEELTAYAQRLGLQYYKQVTENLQHFEASGYIRLASDQMVALLDVAPIGPDYLPGHAHADTLSFELSLFGQRVVTNGGTSEYGDGLTRQLERGTAAHSTVTINSENSSEVWGGFRVARRAYPFGLEIKESEKCISVRCSHNGYYRLRGKPVHQREWQWSESSLQVTDTVIGFAEHAVARFHFNPEINVVEFEQHYLTLKLPNGKLVWVYINQGTAQLGKSHYAPEFGKRLPRACLAVELIGLRSSVRFVWANNH